MKTLLFVALTAQLCHVAFAQDGAVVAGGDRPSPPSVFHIDEAAGQPEAFFKEHFGRYVLASFHYGSSYDVTYYVGGTGLLTVQFFEGEAGFFRLITSRPRASAEVLPRMLGIDTARLKLTREIDVMKVWEGRLGDVMLDRVAVITGLSGWNMVMVQVAGYSTEP